MKFTKELIEKMEKDGFTIKEMTEAYYSSPVIIGENDDWGDDYSTLDQPTIEKDVIKEPYIYFVLYKNGEKVMEADNLVEIANYLDEYYAPENEDIVINVGNGVKMIVSVNQKPYDKEVGIYLEKDGEDGFVQDIARISPNYFFMKDKINYLKDNILVKLFTDVNNEDYDLEKIISIMKNK